MRGAAWVYICGLAQLADILTDSSERQRLLEARNKEEVCKILYDRKEGQNVRNK